MTPNLSDQERLVVVETKLDTVIEQQKGISITLNTLVPTLVTQTQFTEKIAILNKDIEDLKTKFETSQKRNALWVWLTGILAAAFGMVMTILIQSYLSK